MLPILYDIILLLCRCTVHKSTATAVRATGSNRAVFLLRSFLFCCSDYACLTQQCCSLAISYTGGFVSRKRPFSTEAQIGLSYTVEKGLFRLNFFRLRIRTGGSSRKLYFFNWILQSKNSVEKVLPPILNPSHRLSQHKAHTHTPTHPYQVPHSSIIQQRRRCLCYHCCCFSPQVSVAHSWLRSPAACITQQQ